MIRFIRDYFTLLAMTNSRKKRVREMSREAVRRFGWTIRPLGDLRWRNCWKVWLKDDGLPSLVGETWLYYNDSQGSTRVVRWCDAIGVLATESEQARNLREYVEKNR